MYLEIIYTNLYRMNNRLIYSTSISVWIAYIWSKKMKQKRRDESSIPKYTMSFCNDFQFC